MMIEVPFWIVIITPIAAGLAIIFALVSFDEYRKEKCDRIIDLEIEVKYLQDQHKADDRRIKCLSCKLQALTSDDKKDTDNRVDWVEANKLVTHIKELVEANTLLMRRIFGDD